MLSEHDHSRLIFQFFAKHLAVHALAKFIKVSNGMLKPFSDLLRDHRSRDQLGVWVLKAGAGVSSVIFENCDVGDPRIVTEFVIARAIDAQDFRKLSVGHHDRKARMIRSLDDHVMNPEAIDGSPRAVDGAGRLYPSIQGREPVGHHANLPGSSAGGNP